MACRRLISWSPQKPVVSLKCANRSVTLPRSQTKCWAARRSVPAADFSSPVAGFQEGGQGVEHLTCVCFKNVALSNSERPIMTANAPVLWRVHPTKSWQIGPILVGNDVGLL